MKGKLRNLPLPLGEVGASAAGEGPCVWLQALKPLTPSFSPREREIEITAAGGVIQFTESHLWP
jgi:hypothetical protein